MFTDKDLRQIVEHGLSVAEVERQLDNFRNGFAYLSIDGAATVGNGIIRLGESEAGEFARLYDRKKEGRKIVKFVPASGAATRMFKELFEYLSDGKGSKTVDDVLEGLERFAFARELKEILGAERDPQRTIGAIIKDERLNYGVQPKALIPFHKYAAGSRTAAEEHLAEGAMYASAGGRVSIHFTVSGEHLAGFKALLNRVLPRYEKDFGVSYDISFSQQKPSTDTIAVNPDNTPFREPDGSLLFRPAGHGALIENLNDIDADLVFIKNIDNVTPDRLKPETVLYKKALAGMLITLQDRAFALTAGLEKGDMPDDAARFVEKQLMYRLPDGFGQRPRGEQREYLLSVLDRPIRVCGVVRNEGEPGGGPFWVRNPDGSASLQIAESSQIAPEDMDMMRNATHFNPVDLVCTIKDRNGRRYDLPAYVDPGTGFISEKSKDGRRLRALELPGLWNGAMARWNTVFVEVPASTFTPVKVVSDLLRPQHQ